MKINNTRYNTNIQLPLHQIEVIAAAIRSRGPACQLLVFGVGHDTGMWIDINKDGYSLFVETSDEWADSVKMTLPEANIQLYQPPPETVSSSLESPPKVMERLTPPSFMTERAWDVIVIDGPPGDTPESPGRALPICWSGAVRSRHTHVFVHDYERELEQLYTDLALRRPHSAHTVISARKGKRQLYRSIGLSD